MTDQQAREGSTAVDMQLPQAQERADQVHAFRRELALLDEEGVLTLPEEGAAAVQDYHDGLLAKFVARFDIDTNPAQKQLSWGMRLASVLGGVALAASIWFFLLQIWGSLGAGVQVAIPLLGTLAFLGATEFLGRREKLRFLAGFSALLSLGCFVINLVVIATVFNVTPSENAFLVWAAFAIVLGYAHRLRLVLAVGLGLAVFSLSAKMLALSGALWSESWTRPELYLVSGLIVFLCAFLPHRGFSRAPSTFRLVGLLTVFLGLFYLCFSAEASVLPIQTDVMEGAYQVIGILVAALAVGLGLRRRWDGVTNLGGCFFFVFLFFKMVDWWWDWMPKYVFFLVFGLSALAVLLATRYFRTRFSREALR